MVEGTGTILMNHNINTFNDAIVHLKQFGKVAVVQPTGTGKSFIAMQIMKTMPNSKKLMLAPNREFLDVISNHEYFDSDNTITLTYQFIAKNKNNIVEKLAEIVDIDDIGLIILDELHRAGSPVWQQTVLQLVDACENASLLGLTATPIRSADKRDMVEELFDGHSVGNISLSDAIQQRILPKLNYVVSMFDANSELNKFMHNNKKHYCILNGMASDYNEIKRKWCIENSFKTTLSRHLTPDGVTDNLEARHIVFVPSIVDVDKYKPLVKKWFEEIYKGYTVNVYAIHSKMSRMENMGVVKAFSSPLNKNEISIMISVQMLTESFHFDKLKSITMLRHTESANVYIQQIGRALSASSAEMPYIFDFVDNFSSIGKIAYLIGSVQRGDNKSDLGVIFNTFINEAEACEDDINKLQKKLDARVQFHTHSLYKYAEEYGCIHDIPNEKLREWCIQQFRWLRSSKPEYIEKHHKEFELSEFIEAKANSKWYDTLKNINNVSEEARKEFVNKTINIEICAGIPQSIKEIIAKYIDIDYSCTNDISILLEPVNKSSSVECKIVLRFMDALTSSNTFKTWYYYGRCIENYSKESNRVYGESNYDKACAHRIFKILMSEPQNQFIKTLELSRENSILFNALYRYKNKNLIGIDNEELQILCSTILSKEYDENDAVTLEILDYFRVLTKKKLVDIVDDIIQLSASVDRIKSISQDIIRNYNPYGSTPEALREAIQKFYRKFDKNTLTPELVDRINRFEQEIYPYIAVALNDDTFYNLDKANCIVEHNRKAEQDKFKLETNISKHRREMHSISKLITNSIGGSTTDVENINKYINLVTDEALEIYNKSSGKSMCISADKQRRISSIYTMHKLYSIGLKQYAGICKVTCDKELMEKIDKVMLTPKLRQTIEKTVSYMQVEGLEFKQAAFEAGLYRMQSQRDEDALELIITSTINKTESDFYKVIYKMDELDDYKYKGHTGKKLGSVVYA